MFFETFCLTPEWVGWGGGPLIMVENQIGRGVGKKKYKQPVCSLKPFVWHRSGWGGGGGGGPLIMVENQIGGGSSHCGWEPGSCCWFKAVTAACIIKRPNT